MAASDDGTAGSGEFEILARVRKRLASGVVPGQGGSPESHLLRQPQPGEVFSGDDTAVLVPPPGRSLFAIDLVVEGVHVDLSLGSLADAGWKAISVNVSDIAAMGGRPLYVVAGVSAPPGTDLDDLTDGMIQACAAYGAALVGGDLTGGERLVIAVAITGTCEQRDPVLRSGARPGDDIWVTGALGLSAAGLELLRRVPEHTDPAAGRAIQAYRRPTARVSEGVTAAVEGATAMIDVSDGLAKDLDHVATESGVGVRLAAVPVAETASLDQALGGGEDYELAFTAPAAAAGGILRAFSDAALRAPIRIGECVDDASERTLESRPLDIVGWEHSFGAGRSSRAR